MQHIALYPAEGLHGTKCDTSHTDKRWPGPVVMERPTLDPWTTLGLDECAGRFPRPLSWRSWGSQASDWQGSRSTRWGATGC